MGKRLNELKLSFNLCRTKTATDAVAPSSAAAASYRLSPSNPKARDINFPKLPSPPPTTPDELNKRRTPPFSILSAASDSSSDSIEFAARTDARWLARTNYATRISLNSCELRPTGWQNPKGKKSAAVVAPCDEQDEEEEEEAEADESESFRYSSGSFSFETASCEFKPCAGETNGSQEEEEGKSLQRRRRRDLLLDGGEAVAVVKKSTNPKEDFKRSMIEMIEEKEMYGAKELEELLQCLLSLNTREYHGDILEAFSEIWKLLFVK